MKIQEAVQQFLIKGAIINDENFFYCETRDQSAFRLSKWLQDFQKLGISLEDSAVLIALIGEITNNSFDHNLGQWNGLPGCVVGFKVDTELISVFIADRGQGALFN